MLFEREKISDLLETLAERQGLHIGTLSWKFPGWCGTLYDEDRYFWGTHFSKARFQRNCLDEYAKVFKTVCVDATYYRMPRDEFLDDLVSRVPEGFRFSFKVPDEVTIKKFPDIPAFGPRRGKINPYFLGEGVFKFGFLRHLEHIRSRVGMLIFEFSHFHTDEFERGRGFVEELDRFFSNVPNDWQYGVEIRNRNLLHPDYFAVLARHGVAHIYNQWTRMPPVTEQLRLHPLEENPFFAARYLLTPDRSLDTANHEFAPFNQLRERDPQARESMQQVLQHFLNTRQRPEQPSYLYIGNQLEGNALHSIADLLEACETGVPKESSGDHLKSSPAG